MTTAEFDVLDCIAWAESVGLQALVTNRYQRKRDADRCMSSGWVRKIQVVKCDEDCAIIEPERYVPGYEFTESGREVYADEKARRR